MSSDYEYTDSDEEYYDDEDMMMDADEDSVSEMDMDNDDFKIPLKEKRKAYQVEYDSLSQKAIEDLMKAELDHISGIFGVNEDVAALLLRYLSWNKERLIEKYMDNASAVTIAAGVSAPEPESTVPLRSSSSRRTTRGGSSHSKSSSCSSKASGASFRLTTPPKPAPFTCSICYDDSPDLQTRSLLCSHVFCADCWISYLTSKVRDEAEHSIRCMAEGCALVAPDSFIRSVLLTSEPANLERKDDDEETWKRFYELTIRHFVACNKNLKYCPYPSCTNTVSCPAIGSSKSALSTMVPIVSCGARGLSAFITTSSGANNASTTANAVDENDKTKPGKEHVYCFGCPVDSDHRPCVCAVAKMWLKKCADDSETANWIKSNTKECSECNSTIEKNGGCNHMTCKKCKHEFCWVCMGPWSEHGNNFYSCNRYEEKSGVVARDAQSRSRSALERYLHYYSRWANHEQSAKLSVDLYAKSELAMSTIQSSSSLSWIEVQFMRKAVDEVVKCRMTLKWTYAMAYYLKAGNEKELFEDNQRDLERAVEELSELLEGGVGGDKGDIMEEIGLLRQKVTDRTVYVGNRNDVVLEDTTRGLLEGRWKWNTQVEGFDDAEGEA